MRRVYLIGGYFAVDRGNYAPTSFFCKKKCGLKIIGTVSGFQVEQRRKTKRYYPVFEFEIKGCRYQGKSHYGTREPRYRLHQPVALQVDARYFVRLYERKELIRTWIFCAVCCSVGGIALFLFFLFAFSPLCRAGKGRRKRLAYEPCQKCSQPEKTDQRVL